MSENQHLGTYNFLALQFARLSEVMPWHPINISCRTRCVHRKNLHVFVQWCLKRFRHKYILSVGMLVPIRKVARLIIFHRLSAALQIRVKCTEQSMHTLMFHCTSRKQGQLMELFRFFCQCQHCCFIFEGLQQMYVLIIPIKHYIDRCTDQ